MILRPYPTGACAPSLDANLQPAVNWDDTVRVKLDGVDAQNLVDDYEKWPARIQGNRPTCVAFAAAACIELLRARQSGRFEPLSPQYLYWYMRQLGENDPQKPPGWTAGATKLRHAMEVLANPERGICSWTDCPYEDEEVGDGDRPKQEANAAIKARISGADPDIASEIEPHRTFYRDWPSGNQPAAGVARMIYDLLVLKRPVAVALPVFYSTLDPRETNWDSPTTTSSGEVEDPDPLDPDDGPDGPTEGWTRELKIAGTPEEPPGHAVCIVGFDPDPREPTGGWFRFRNSRGLVWASHCNKVPERFALPGTTRSRVVPARGYGSISATYIEHYCWEIFSPALAQ